MNEHDSTGGQKGKTFHFRFIFKIFLGCSSLVDGSDDGLVAPCALTSRLPRLSLSVRISLAFSEANDSTRRHAAPSKAPADMMPCIALAVRCWAVSALASSAGTVVGTPLSPLPSLKGGGEDALIVALLLCADTHVYSEGENTGCSGVVALFLMSGLSVALLFAYLAVRPREQVATADGGRLVPNKPATSVKVESVKQGDLTAKMQAKNQCASSNGWRVLFGFYVTATAWRKCVRGVWTKTAESEDWEACVREGLKLAKKHNEGSVVYVSTAARCRPESPLLTFLQRLQVAGKEASDGACVFPPKEFWRLVGSRRSTKWVNAQLEAQLRRSSTAL